MRPIKALLTLPLIGSATFLLSACSTLQTTTLPLENGNYKVIATAGNMSEATSGAAKQAAQICSKQGKTFKTISMYTTYQGAGKNLETASTVATNVIWATSHTLIPSTKSAEDYQTNLIFSCS